MAIVDAKCNFLAIDVGSPGSFSDSTIFKNTDYGRALYENPHSIPFPNSGIIIISPVFSLSCLLIL